MVADLDPNPLRNARLRLDMTQEEVANTLDISRGAILRYEQGTYGLPSGRLINFYQNRLGLKNLAVDYLDWQKTKRNALQLNYIDRHSWLEMHPLTEVRLANGYRSIYKFCQALCLPPEAVTKYETGRQKEMPTQLRWALEDCGWRPEQIEGLKRYAHDYSEANS